MYPAIVAHVQRVVLLGRLQVSTHGGNRQVCRGSPVLCDHRDKVHTVRLAADQDQNPSGLLATAKVQVLVERISRSRVPVHGSVCLVGVQQGESPLPAIQVPRPSVAQVSVEGSWPVLGQHADCVDL